MKTWSQYYKAVQKLEILIDQSRVAIEPLAELDPYFNTDYLSGLRDRCETFKDLFRMVVIGKFSSGKSTFINALLGNPSFLPSDLRQSTGVVTRIRYGKSEQVSILFADGCKKLVAKEEIASFVKIPEKYQDLSLYDINCFISEDTKAEDIIAMNELWENSDRKTLEDYLKQYPKSRIVKECLIESPFFPEEMKGWEIIDTPGFDNSFANCTKDYLRDNQNSINAVVYLHDGRSSVQDQSATSYFKEIDKLNPRALECTFYAISHSSQITPSEKKKQSEDALKSLSKKGIDSEHLFFIDSIAQLLLSYGINECNGCSRLIQLSRSEVIPEMWTQDVWEIADGVIGKARNMIWKERGDDEITDGDMARALASCSGFTETIQTQRGLLDAIDAFVHDHRRVYYESLINDYLASLKQIKDRIASDIDQYNKKISDIGAAQNSYQERENEAAAVHDKLNKAFQDVANKYNRKSVEAHLMPKYYLSEKEVKASKSFSDIFEAYKSGADRIRFENERFFSELKKDYVLILQESEKQSLRNTPLMNLDEKKKAIEIKRYGPGFWGWFKKLFSSSKPVINEMNKAAISGLFSYVLDQVEAFLQDQANLDNKTKKEIEKAKQDIQAHQIIISQIMQDSQRMEDMKNKQSIVYDILTRYENEVGVNGNN